MEELNVLELWSLSSLDHKKSPTNFIDKLSRYNNHDQIWEQHICECVEYDFKEAFKEIVDEYNNDLKGLCVNCVKSGKFNKEDGNYMGDLECTGQTNGANPSSGNEAYPLRYFVLKLGGGWKSSGMRSGIRGGRGYFGASRGRGPRGGGGRGGYAGPTFIAEQGYVDDGHDKGSW